MCLQSSPLTQSTISVSWKIHGKQKLLWKTQELFVSLAGEISWKDNRMETTHHTMSSPWGCRPLFSFLHMNRDKEENVMSNSSFFQDDFLFNCKKNGNTKRSTTVYFLQHCFIVWLYGWDNHEDDDESSSETRGEQLGCVAWIQYWIWVCVLSVFCVWCIIDWGKKKL